jgi:hypothetical protein
MAMRGLLSVLLVVAIAACGSKPPTGPAWPAPSTTADDGGESLEPRSTAVATAIEKSEDEAPEKPADQPEIVAKPGAAAAEPETPATVSPPTSVSDDVIMSEEIIIEIED